jgi:hypothetical protein
VLTWPPYSYSYEHLKFGVLMSNAINLVYSYEIHVLLYKPHYAVLLNTYTCFLSYQTVYKRVFDCAKADS